MSREGEHTAEKDATERERLIQIDWPALWCLVFFVAGFIVGRAW